MKKVLFFLLGLGLAVQQLGAQNQFKDPILQEIYELQDQRKSTELIKYLKNDFPAYRAAAATGFASTQDSVGLPILIELLQDKSVSVRQATAYALGQIGKKYAEEAILQAIDNEVNTTVKCYLLESLGKCNGATALSYLCQTDFSNDSLNLGMVRGLYRVALKNQRSEEATRKVISLISSPYSLAREMAGFYLARFANSLNLKPFQAELLKILQNNYPDTSYLKINIATALATLIAPEVAVELQKIVKSKADYRLRLSALKALTKQKNVKPFLKEALLISNPHLALEASRFWLEKAEAEDYQWLSNLSRKSKPDYWQVKINLMTALAKMDSSSATYEKMKALYLQSKNIYERAAWLRAIATQAKNYEWLASEFEKTNNILLKVGALEALNTIRQSAGFLQLQNLSQAHKRFGEIYKQAILSEDVGLIYTASGVLLDEKMGYKSYYTDYQFITNTLAKIKMPRDVEAYIELQKVLAYFEGKPEPQSYPVSALEPMDWSLVKTIPSEQKVLIRTSEGSILLKLLVNEAPASVATFVKLVKQGFYKGKSFHRVVSNFVVQGGCPRGDGFGGLDYTIRSEFAPLNYQTGSVGLASAGKDTESCQFFITHLPTPHLDGRYTIFAQVIKGMEVVDQLMIGGRIEEIRLVE
jgi:cyclophilin family peptidyl-prolyl cis-trans isomerase/HEAT repeat protein